MTMNLVGASICDEELIVQGEARDIQLPNTEHVSQISVDVSERPRTHNRLDRVICCSMRSTGASSLIRSVDHLIMLSTTQRHLSVAVRIVIE